MFLDASLSSGVKATAPSSLLTALIGIGLRSPHYQEVRDTLPPLGFLEVHSENFMIDGGPSYWLLEELREQYPISLHGVSLSLGSADPLNTSHLQRLKKLVDWVNPILVSEHLSWTNSGGNSLNDLLPLPYTEESLHFILQAIDHVQNTLQRQILIENPSTYLQFNHSTMSEPEFLSEIAQRSGCGILLDINNIVVSSHNHNFNAKNYLNNIPIDSVKEVHLAGHEIFEVGQGQSIRIDTHSAAVDTETWELYKCALQKFGVIPTLIEWDSNLPSLKFLLQEAHKTLQMMTNIEESGQRHASNF